MNWCFLREHAADVWFPQNRNEMDLMYEYLTKSLDYDSDVKIWLGFQQLFSDHVFDQSWTCSPDTWVDGRDSQCTDEYGNKSDLLINRTYTAKDVRLGFRELRNLPTFSSAKS